LIALAVWGWNASFFRTRENELPPVEEVGEGGFAGIGEPDLDKNGLG
jgi:hypothetical protein